MSYLPIEHHGVVGDLHTAALVGIDGTVDWLCLPNFDSPSLFASILDAERGGFFRVAATSAEARRKQMYLPDTNILLTRFLTPDGVGEVVDFMPIHPGPGKTGRDDHRLVRLVRGVRGAIPFRMECRPRFDYARRDGRCELTPSGARFTAGDDAVDLAAGLPVATDGRDATADFLLNEGDEIPIVLCGSSTADHSRESLLRRTRAEFRETVRYWQDWIARSSYAGRWREMVKRSCLTLKLLTFARTGAIIAAPTTSLPERIGGDRNWDYRYTWVRDAAFTLYALIRVGFAEEAQAFVDFLEKTCGGFDLQEGLHVLYGIDGRTDLAEQTLTNLSGYRDSAPVRVGNDAVRQLQLDVTGELIDAIYLYNKHGAPISYDLWVAVRRLADWVCDHWRREDEGIWEVRGGARHFTFSKMMCWVALDRAGRLAVTRSFPADRHRWLANRDEIYETIMARGYSSKRRAFVQSFDSDVLDASMLLAPMVKFVAPTDPRMLSTLDAVQRDLVSDSLVHRYDPRLVPDGIGGAEGTFSMCTFWLAEALARAGRIEEARLTFEKMLGYANHLGLFAEQIASTGEQLGNFPQALTHLGLISAAFNISRILDGHVDGRLAARSTREL